MATTPMMRVAILDNFTRSACLANPSARSLVQLAHAQAIREEFVQSWDIKPVYLRQPDAEINWKTRKEES